MLHKVLFEFSTCEYFAVKILEINQLSNQIEAFQSIFCMSIVLTFWDSTN